MLEKSVSVKLVLAALMVVISSTSARADEGSVPYSSSESYESRGVGFRGANRIEFKYKERLKNWGEQIQMGINKGWLSDADASAFKDRLEKLRTLEADVSSKGYPKPELDDMEKQFTKYNQDLSDAGTKSTAPPVPKGVDKSPADVLPADSDATQTPDASSTDGASSASGPSTPSDKKNVDTTGSAKPATVKSTTAPQKTVKKSVSKKTAPKKPVARKK